MYTPGQLILDDSYRIERELGRGAFGLVYLARHQKLGVERAIKVLHADGDGIGSTVVRDYRGRFLLEAKLAAQLTHPHVIQVHDFVEWQNALHCIMEYAPGGSLKDLLAKDGPLPVERVVALLLDCCAGLEAIHDRLDAVHRDVKPANLLLDAQGRVKVADLGLAQEGGMFDSQGSAFLSVMPPHPGTPSYSSPEHRDGSEPLGPAADVYGLGCVAFELLTGKLWKKVRTQVDGPRELREEAPAWLDAVVARMLAEEPPRRKADRDNPKLRYVDAAAVRAAIAAGEKPVAAAPQAAPPAQYGTQAPSLADAPLGGPVSMELVKILKCPEDGGPLELANDGKFLLNPRNGYRYPIRNGVPVMLVTEGQAFKIPVSAPGSLSRGDPKPVVVTEDTRTEEERKKQYQHAQAVVDRWKSDVESRRADVRAAKEKEREIDAALKHEASRSAWDKLRRGEGRYTVIDLEKAKHETARLEALVTYAVAELERALANVARYSPKTAGSNTPVKPAAATPAAAYRSETERLAAEYAARTKAEADQKAAEAKAAAEKAAQEQEAAKPLLAAIFERTAIELVYIPAGLFLYGDEKKRVTLPSYWIGKTPVTNAQYARFVTMTDRDAPAHWTLGRIPQGLENHPVVNVSWVDAQAYCKWAGLVLPSEQQWEKAARGTDGRTYPWGEQEPTTELCSGTTSGRRTTKPVGGYPKGASPYGLLDAAGNVWEWCADWSDNNKQTRVLRGGDFVNGGKTVDVLRCAYRNWGFPGYRLDDRGFRVGSPGF